MFHSAPGWDVMVFVMTAVIKTVLSDVIIAHHSCYTLVINTLLTALHCCHILTLYTPLHRTVYRSVLYLSTVLYYCTVLYCIVLYCTELYCTVLYCTHLVKGRKVGRLASLSLSDWLSDIVASEHLQLQMVRVRNFICGRMNDSFIDWLSELLISYLINYCIVCKHNKDIIKTEKRKKIVNTQLIELFWYL